MSFFERLLEFRDTAGAPVSAHGVTVTPWSRAVVVRLPGARFVWNQPLRVDVTRDGQSEGVPIAGVNRAVWAGLLGLLAAGGVVWLLADSWRSERKEIAT